ncbi:MAG: hypothetical protein HDS12_06670 [Bacteroides sp.]|nr:hypothetical protein [Bacteroides sp.]
MNTNYDDSTQYQGADNEATKYEETSTAEQTNQDAISNDEVEVKSAKKSVWKRAAVGAGSGLLIGGVATVLMGMKSANSEPIDGKQENENHKDELSNPEWVDDQIQVATSVSDDMSFGEAFAVARAEVGPGGCFEWHGNVYGTYTADEWNNMTAEERADWSDHFSWNHIDHLQSNVAQHSITAHSSHPAQAHTTASADDDIEVVSVNHDNNHNEVAQNTNHTEQLSNQAEVVEVSHVDAPTVDEEIEILGVVHDNETGANIGGMMVDNQEVILIDVDGDLAFDYMATDLNHNGEVDQNELVDIQGQNLTVNDIGGFTNPAVDMMASNDAPDYSSDIYEG